MIINRFTSSKEIVEAVYRDNGYQFDLPWIDLQYWIYECLELIGDVQQYIPKFQGVNSNPALEITDYKAKLPCDFHRLMWILVNGCPARLQTGGAIHLLDGECCDLSLSTATLSGETFTDGFGNVFDNSLGSVSAVKNCNDMTFDINNDYLTLSVKEGSVCIGYYAFAIDDDGFPMIPDEAVYKLAVTKYLTKKLDWIEFRKGNIDKDVYKESEQDCNWYMGQVTNAVKMPDVHQMEVLKRNLLRLIPRNNDYSTMFRYLGTGERRPRL